MAYATTYEYFKGVLSIPNLSTGKPDRTWIDTVIEQYEFQLLTTLFGYDMAVLVQDEIDNSTGNTPYTEIVNGVQYTDNAGVVRNWRGFVNSEKVSPLANYFYCEYLRFKEVNTSGIGEMRLAAENARLADGSVKLTRAWNDMVAQLWLLDGYLQSIKDTPDEDSTYIGYKYMPTGKHALCQPNQELFVTMNPFGF